MHSSNGFCAAGRYKFSTSVRACFCSVNFRPLLFYCTNKLVRSYLLHIFIWLYIFPLSTKGEWRQLRLRDVVNCSTQQDIRLCSDPLAKPVNITSCILSRGSWWCAGEGSCLHTRNALPLSRAHCDGSYWLQKVFSAWRSDQCPKGKKVFGSSTRKKYNTSLGNVK